MKIKANKNLTKLSPKKFILKHLIPFILRDAGRGFAMDTWRTHIPDLGEPLYYDDVKRNAPACGTVACIGGSIQCLTGLDPRTSHTKVAKLLGVTKDQAHGLFFDWAVGEIGKNGWPDKYAERYRAANTPYKKARVACSLLKQIAKKGSKALPNHEVHYY